MNIYRLTRLIVVVTTIIVAAICLKSDEPHLQLIGVVVVVVMTSQSWREYDTVRNVFTGLKRDRRIHGSSGRLHSDWKIDLALILGPTAIFGIVYGIQYLMSLEVTFGR